MKRLALIIALAACGGSSAKSPSNASTTSDPPKASAPTCDAKTCTDCIAQSCQWDIEKKSCATGCDADAKNCLSFAANDPGQTRAAEVCATAKQ